MHLPVRLGQIFVVNYVASLLAVSILLCAGHDRARRRPRDVARAADAAVSRWRSTMVFMITAWTYCLRGWLATLMSNPRRRRAIIMGLTTAFI